MRTRLAANACGASLAVFHASGRAQELAHAEGDARDAVHFAISCDTAVQPALDRAVAILRSHSYADARRRSAMTQYKALLKQCAPPACERPEAIVRLPSPAGRRGRTSHRTTHASCGRRALKPHGQQPWAHSCAGPISKVSIGRPITLRSADACDYIWPA